jgi:hypothetical protein
MTQRMRVLLLSAFAGHYNASAFADGDGCRTSGTIASHCAHRPGLLPSVCRSARRCRHDGVHLRCSIEAQSHRSSISCIEARSAGRGHWASLPQHG